MVSKRAAVVAVWTESTSPALGSPKPPLPEGPRVVPGNTDDEDEVGFPAAGVPIVGVPVVGIPVVGFPVVGVPMVGVPVVGVPIVGVPVVGVPVLGVTVVGVPVEPEPDKQLEAVEGGELVMLAAPLKSQVAPEEALR